MPHRYVNYNGNILPGDDPLIGVQSRVFRFGDGLFETMRMKDGAILNRHAHFSRLFTGLDLLKYPVSLLREDKFFLPQILRLCEQNEDSSARIRLCVFRESGAYNDVDTSASFLIESFPLEQPIAWQPNGLAVGIHPEVRKACDRFANLKSNNFLPYVVAGMYAKEQGLDECIILNCYGRVCESSIANLFIVEGKKILTPPLAEGCVAGTMRNFFLKKFPGAIEEIPISVDRLLNAEEIFLTNAIQPIRWVKRIGEKTYSSEVTHRLFANVVATISQNYC